jgi:glutathione S-transferase
MKLFWFDYSNYCRKVQMALEIAGRPYQVVEVSYGEREELLRVSGGLRVPVLLAEDGQAIGDSRRICQYLASGPGGEKLVPPAMSGPIWGFSDFCDGPLEDALFRLATPGIRRRFGRPMDRAMFTLIKERRYGAGCVEAWEGDETVLAAGAREALGPLLATLERQPFVFGNLPTLADAALYGQIAMLKIGGQDLAALGKPLVAWMARLPNAV